MSNKRKLDDENSTQCVKNKRHFSEENLAKIRLIAQTHFEDEINYKKSEIDKISQVILFKVIE
jgi:hypothetical protein